MLFDSYCGDATLIRVPFRVSEIEGKGGREEGHKLGTKKYHLCLVNILWTLTLGPVNSITVYI